MRFKFDLAAMAARAGRKRPANLATIEPTQAQGSELAALYIRPLRLIAERVRDDVLPAYMRAIEQVKVRDSASSGAGKRDIRDDVSDIQGELDSLDMEVQRLVVSLNPEVRRWVVRLEAWHRRRFIASVLTATSVSLETMIGPEEARETMEASLGRNMDLIKDVSTQAKAKASDAVWRGFQSRSPARKVAKEITEALQVSKARALRIASHQAQLLSVSLDQERQTQAGITAYVWRHSRKAHPRQEHVERDGKAFKWAKPPTDGPPGTLPFCGCKAQARIAID